MDTNCQKVEQRIEMWVTLELNPQTDEWVPVGTTHVLGRMKRFWYVSMPATVWPLLIAMLLVSAGVLSAVWGYSGDSEIQVGIVELANTESSKTDASIYSILLEPKPAAPIVTKSVGGKVSRNPQANASLWLTNSPPVSDYRSVSAGNWLSQ